MSWRVFFNYRYYSFSHGCYRGLLSFTAWTCMPVSQINSIAPSSILSFEFERLKQQNSVASAGPKKSAGGISCSNRSADMAYTGSYDSGGQAAAIWSWSYCTKRGRFTGNALHLVSLLVLCAAHCGSWHAKHLLIRAIFLLLLSQCDLLMNVLTVILQSVSSN